MDNPISYFLDHSVIMGYLIGESGVKQQLFDLKKYPRCRISIATLSYLYEMYPDYRRYIEKFAGSFEVVDFKITDFDELVKIRSELENDWQIDNFWDLLFAAHVRAHKAIMVTTTGKGERFPNIKKLVDENWGSGEQVVLEFTGITGNERGVIYKIAETISNLDISIDKVDAATQYNSDYNVDEHKLELTLDLTGRDDQNVLDIRTNIRYAMNYTVGIDIDDTQPHATGFGNAQNQQFVCIFMAANKRPGLRPDGNIWPKRIIIKGTNRVGLLKDITRILYENYIDIISATTPVPATERAEGFKISLTLMPESARPSDNLFAEICEKIKQIEQVQSCEEWKA